jgi:uncharacterized membrane protein YesL
MSAVFLISIQCIVSFDLHGICELRVSLLLTLMACLRSLLMVLTGQVLLCDSSSCGPVVSPVLSGMVMHDRTVSDRTKLTSGGGLLRGACHSAACVDAA